VAARADTQRDVAAHRHEVLAAISAVRDPEIDEAVGTLGFELDAEVDASGHVTVSMRLPTFWCPANFAFLIGEDMRRTVLALPWVTGCRLRLLDHFAGEEIGHGVSAGQGFDAAFPAHAGCDIGRLRRDFDEKAFLIRQGELAKALRRRGWSDAALAALSVEDAARLDDPEVATLVAACLAKREQIGLNRTGHVLVDTDGAAVAQENVAAHLQAIRATAISARANGEMCRMLAAARHEIRTPG
jgi:metal-sulfur cluster biosynthetic enzyme